MTTRTKIDVQVRALSMEFGDTLVVFSRLNAHQITKANYSIVNPRSNFLKDIVNHSRAKSDSSNLSWTQQKAETDSTHKMSNPNRVGQLKPRSEFDISPLRSPPIELKPLPDHLKYAYLDNAHQFPVIIANNLYREILMEEEARPIRQQQRRLNPTILDVIKKEVTKLLATRIIYPI
ncbi:hypothetical protein CR513_41417, partial [Mucuna pruriens]